MICSNDLKRGDKILGWSPWWVNGIIREMVVCAVKDNVIQLKETDGSPRQGWWRHEDIKVYEVLNRKVIRRKKQKESPKQRIDINLINIGDIILYGLPWTEYLYEATVQDIKDNLIGFIEAGQREIEWKQKTNIMVMEIIGKRVVEKKERGTCPFMSTVETKVECNALCELHGSQCAIKEMVSWLREISGNVAEITDDE